jgi:uncharacterized DUF497 family protein
LRFTWDRAKAAANARKHGVTFEEAVTSFADPLSITIPGACCWWLTPIEGTRSV